jgi:hypothetical protein
MNPRAATDSLPGQRTFLLLELAFRALFVLRLEEAVMRHDPTRLVVIGVEPLVRTASSAWLVHHRDFPELQVEGGTAREGVQRLGQELTLACDWVCEPWRRDALSEALSDVDAYLGFEAGAHD